MSHIHFDDTVFDFYSRFISWIADALEQEDMIIVEGKPVKSKRLQNETEEPLQKRRAPYFTKYSAR